VLLRDLDIHGLANTGIQAGRLTDWTVENVRLAGNGLAGWNGDHCLMLRKDGLPLLALDTLWATDKDAREFADRWRAMKEVRPNAAAVEEIRALGGTPPRHRVDVRQAQREEVLLGRRPAPPDPEDRAENGVERHVDDVAEHHPFGESEIVFVRELDENRFATVMEVAKYLTWKHYLTARSYADNQIPCPRSYPTATNWLEIIGHIDEEQLTAMLADCLDVDQIGVDPMQTAHDLAAVSAGAATGFRHTWKSTRSKNPHHLRFNGGGELAYMRDGIITTTNGFSGTYDRVREFAGQNGDEQEVVIRIACEISDERKGGDE
jgi:hypothetical protein